MELAQSGELDRMADDATLRAGTPPPAIVMHGRCGGKYRVSDRYGYQYSGAWGMGLGAP